MNGEVTCTLCIGFSTYTSQTYVTAECFFYYRTVNKLTQAQLVYIKHRTEECQMMSSTACCQIHQQATARWLSANITVDCLPFSRIGSTHDSL